MQTTEDDNDFVVLPESRRRWSWWCTIACFGSSSPHSFSLFSLSVPPSLSNFSTPFWWLIRWMSGCISPDVLIIILRMFSSWDVFFSSSPPAAEALIIWSDGQTDWGMGRTLCNTVCLGCDAMCWSLEGVTTINKSNNRGRDEEKTFQFKKTKRGKPSLSLLSQTTGYDCMVGMLSWPSEWCKDARVTSKSNPLFTSHRVMISSSSHLIFAWFGFNVLFMTRIFHTLQTHHQNEDDVSR